jgi:hypothetical protein
VLVSATLPTEVLEMTQKFMTDPIRVLVKRDELTLEVRVSLFCLPFSYRVALAILLFGDLAVAHMSDCVQWGTRVLALPCPSIQSISLCLLSHICRSVHAMFSLPSFDVGNQAILCCGGA